MAWIMSTSIQISDLKIFVLLYGNINNEYKLTPTENRITRKYVFLYDLYKGTFFNENYKLIVNF